MKNIPIIITNFDVAINEIKQSNLQKLVKLHENIRISKDSLHQLRIALRKKNFISQKDEILFFKHQKPYVQGRLNFYLKLNTFLLECPKIGNTEQRNYINKQLHKLNLENSKYLVFLKYYRLKSSKLDHLYFLRGNSQLELFISKNNHLDDPEFCTSHDHLVSKIITNDLLTRFYAKELALLQPKDSKIIIEEVKPAVLKDLTWTASKTDLIELVYALHASGVICNGDIELKKIMDACSEVLNIDLGNYYKTYAQIKERQKDPAKFLDKLKLNLLRKLDLEN